MRVPARLRRVQLVAVRCKVEVPLSRDFLLPAVRCGSSERTFNPKVTGSIPCPAHCKHAAHACAAGASDTTVACVSSVVAPLSCPSRRQGACEALMRARRSERAADENEAGAREPDEGSCRG